MTLTKKKLNQVRHLLALNFFQIAQITAKKFSFKIFSCATEASTCII